MQSKMLGLILAIVFVAGCATDRARTQAEGTAAGAGTGAGIGALLGYVVGGKGGAALGAVIGGLVGGGVGLAAGTHVANKKAEYASQEEYLDAVITSARTMNARTWQYNASLRNEIKKLDDETTLLVRQYNERQIRKTALEAKRKEAEGKLSKARAQLQAVNTEIEVQRKVLNQEKQDVRSAQAQNRLNTMDAEIRQLERARADLEQQVTTLAAIGARMQV